MSNIPARVAADGAQADADLAALAAQLNAANAQPTPAANELPTEPTPPAPPAEPVPPTPAVPADMAAVLAQMQRSLDSQQGRLDAAERDRAELQRRLEEATRTPATPSAPAPNAVTAQDMSEFGEETIGMVRRVVADETRALREENNRLTQTIAQLQGQAQRAGQTAEQAAQAARVQAENAFATALDQRIPGWEAVNTDPAFELWLRAERDPFNGSTYLELLQSAYQALDSGRVTAIFTRYKPELAKGNPSATANPAAPKAPTIDPNSQVAPAATAANVAPPSQQQGRVYESKEFDDMHDKMLKKKISPEDFAAFERDYYAAMREGRVAVSI